MKNPFPMNSEISLPISTSATINKSLKILSANPISFTISQITPKQLKLINYNVSYQDYLDKNFSRDCGIPNGHRQLFDLMKFWIEFTGTHDIPWWLSYGSLIGSVRHEDMVPWDGDIDLVIPAQYESLLRKLHTPREKMSDKQVNIITRPGPHCPYNGPRLDCKGKSVTSQVDGCAFCGPLARVFYAHWKRIDVYVNDIQMHENQLKVIDEGNFEYSTEPPRHPYEWYFPLRNCQFMGLTVQCPRKSEDVLTHIYKDYRSHYFCKNGKWEKV